MGERVTSATLGRMAGCWRRVVERSPGAVGDAATGKPKDTDEANHFRLFGVAFSPDGATIAAGGDAVVLMWEIKTRRVRRIIQGSEGPHLEPGVQPGWQGVGVRRKFELRTVGHANGFGDRRSGEGGCEGSVPAPY